MASSYQATQDISLAFLIARLWAARIGVALFVLVVTALAYLYTQTSSPRFEAEAQLLIEPQETAFTRPEAEGSAQPQSIDERDVASQVQVLRSRDIANEVIQQLGLTDDPRFDAAREGVSVVKSVMVMLGLADDPLRLSAEERVYERFNEGLNVFSIPGSRVVVVTYRSADPELSAQIANAVVETYQMTQRATQASNTRSATSFLEAEIADLRAEVAEAEATVARFRSGSGLFMGVNDTTLSAQQLSELSSELTRARAAVSEAQSRANEIRLLIEQQGAQVALPDSLATPLTRRLQEEQAAIGSRIAELSATLLPAHPRLQELNAQLSDLGRQIRREAVRIAERFDNEARVAQARSQALEDALARQSAEASRVADAEVELRALEREAAAQRDLLASYLVRFREAATREDAALLPTNARIIQTASAQREPVFPQTMPIIIIAFVGSLAMSVLAVMSLAILSGATREEGVEGGVDETDEPGREPSREPPTWMPAAQADAQEQPAISGGRHEDTSRSDRDPMTGMASDTEAVRTFDSKEPVVARSQQVAAFQHASAAQAPLRRYSLTDPSASHALFAHLRRLAPGERGSRFTVLAADGAGMAFDLALPLARCLSDAGQSVVLVDPLGEMAGLDIAPDGPGFFELATGEAGFDTALHADPESDVHLIPAGFSRSARAMITDEAAELLLSALAKAYDVVITTIATDQGLARLCAPTSDAMILAGSAAHTTRLAGFLSDTTVPERMLAISIDDVLAPVESVPA